MPALGYLLFVYPTSLAAGWLLVLHCHASTLAVLVLTGSNAVRPPGPCHEGRSEGLVIIIRSARTAETHRRFRRIAAVQGSRLVRPPAERRQQRRTSVP